LDIILQAKGLGMRKSGNVLWIAPKDEIAAREKQELESKASIESLETLRTQGFQMNYAKAADIATQLTSRNRYQNPGSSSDPDNRLVSRFERVCISRCRVRSDIWPGICHPTGWSIRVP
jgi:type IV pilus assembly protein PilQ